MLNSAEESQKSHPTQIRPHDLVHLKVDIAMTQVPGFVIGWRQRRHSKVMSTCRNRAESAIPLLPNGGLPDACGWEPSCRSFKYAR